MSYSELTVVEAFFAVLFMGSFACLPIVLLCIEHAERIRLWLKSAPPNDNF